MPPHLKVLHGLFDKLVFSKIRERFGGRVRFFISGAAALNRDVAEWFHAAGILILEGYGMTESSAGSVVNHPDDYKFGTVGIPLPGTEIKIAEDGEILHQGPGRDGGLPQHARGDRRDAHRRVAAHRRHRRVRRRPPADHRPQEGPVQDLGRQVHRAVRDRVAVQGDLPASQPVPRARQRAQLLRRAGRARPRRARRLGATTTARRGKSYDELVKAPELEQEVADYIEQLNERLNRWESIKKWIILDHDLTVESGELTPSMKVKRKVVEDNYKAEIDKLYA